ncbi:hypothetical protein BJ741DRAFT_651083 [Chytriomyces cf. hyalinus JEL632]|nr:hypothetical protein BJ741DRAFT_651083 [Chytriomyces cf. hyalinus JEL632]
MNSEWEQYYLATATAGTDQLEQNKEQYSEEYKERHRLAWAQYYQTAKAAIVNPFAPPIPVPTESNSQPQNATNKPMLKKRIVFDPSKPKKPDPVRQQQVSPPAVDNHTVNTDSNTAPTTNDCVSDSFSDRNGALEGGVTVLDRRDMNPSDPVEVNHNISAAVQQRVPLVEPVESAESRPSNILKLVLKPTTELRLKEPVVLSADEQALSEFDKRIEAEESALQAFVEEHNRAMDRILVLIEARRGQCEQRVILLQQAKEEERERRETRRRLDEEKRIFLESQAAESKEKSLPSKEAEPTTKPQPKQLDASDTELNASIPAGEKKRGIGGRDGGPRLYLPSEHDIRQMQLEEQKAKELASYVKSTLPCDGYKSRYRHDNADNSYSANTNHSNRHNGPYRGRYERSGGARGEYGRILSRSPSPSYRRRSRSRNTRSRSPNAYSQKYRSNSRSRSQSRSVSPFLRDGSRPARELDISKNEQRRSSQRTTSPPPRPLLNASSERLMSAGTVPVAPPPLSLQIGSRTQSEAKEASGDPEPSPFSDVDVNQPFKTVGDKKDSHRKRRPDNDGHAEDGESAGRGGKRTHRHQHHHHHRDQRGHREGRSHRHSSQRRSSREKGGDSEAKDV